MHYTRIRTQLGNGGEVTKYLQQIKDADLGSTQVQFAIQVWAALKSENAVRFFNLLRKADVLQASLMHRYVGEVRLAVSTYVRRERIDGSYFFHFIIFMFFLVFTKKNRLFIYLNIY